MESATETATELTIPSEVYHAMAEVSASGMKVFREDEETYYRRYVAKTEPFPPPTPQMQLGTATHWAVLQPEQFAKKVCEAPSWARTKRMQEAVANSRPGAMVLEGADVRRIQAMAEACRAAAGDYLAAPGKIEASLFATDAKTGLKLKGRCDKIIECSDGSVLILDLKTTARLDGFADSYLRYGYDLQEAMYLEIGRQFFQAKPIVFRFLLVQTMPPHIAEWRQTTVETLAAAQASWRQTLDRLAECYASNWTCVLGRLVTETGDAQHDRDSRQFEPDCY